MGATGNKSVDAQEVWWRHGELLIKLVPHTEGVLLLRSLHEGFVLPVMGTANDKCIVPISCYPKEIGGNEKLEKIRSNTSKSIKKELLQIYFDRITGFIDHATIISEENLYYIEIPENMKAAVETKKAAAAKK